MHTGVEVTVLGIPPDAGPTNLQPLLQNSPACPFHAGFPHPATQSGGSAALAARHALPQYSWGWPFHVGFPQPGYMHTGFDPVLAIVTPPGVRDGLPAGVAPAVRQTRPQNPCGCPFHVGLPQPALMQTGAVGARGAGLWALLPFDVLHALLQNP